MNAQENLLADLKIRLGYKQEIILTRDEFILIVEGDMGIQKELEEEIEDLEGETSGLKSECEDLENEIIELKEQVKELEEKLDKIEKILEE